MILGFQSLATEFQEATLPAWEHVGRPISTWSWAGALMDVHPDLRHAFWWDAGWSATLLQRMIAKVARTQLEMIRTVKILSL